MRAYIQHQDKSGQKLILQALVPFAQIKDCVLFTYRANVSDWSEDKHAQFKASMEFYQRRVDAKRSNEIKDFIRNSILQERSGIQMATLFPTSMILAIGTDYEEQYSNRVEVNSDGICELEIRKNVFIVDGQHRMMGMIKLFDELDRFVVRGDEDEYVYQFLRDYRFNCTILVNYDLWEQGQVFVNVNFKQKPVNKSLYYEIFGAEYSENKSDWERNKVYLAHQMVRMLNEHEKSPFYSRIKMLGTGEGYVSQAFVVEALMRLFKKNALWYFNPDKEQTGDVDTSYFGTELLSFFVAVKRLLPDYWPKEDATRGTIICKTTGVGAWIRLMGTMREDGDMELRAALKTSAERGEVCEKYVTHVTNIIKPLKDAGGRLFGEKSEFKSSSGQGSESKLFKKMLYFIQNPISRKRNTGEYPFNVDVLSEKIQEYVWTNPIDDLDPLGHHYDVEDLSDFTIDSSKEGIDALMVKASFTLTVNIYLDNEADSNFYMEFPTTCKVMLEKENGGYEPDMTSVEINVDTDKFYE